MTVADEVRRMCRTQWFHVLGVCLITAIVVASVITAMTDKRFVIVVQHSLVHSLTMGALCWATLSFFIVPRVRLKDDGRTELVVSRDRVRALKERLGLV